MGLVGRLRYWRLAGCLDGGSGPDGWPLGPRAPRWWVTNSPHLARRLPRKGAAMKVPGIATLSCVLAVLTPHEARPSDDDFVVRSLVQPAAGGVALHWAVVGARQRLEHPACRGLLSEYSDASRRTLQENLEAIGETGGNYLARILFADGSGRSRCTGYEAYAFTTGSRVVYVWGRAFKALASRDPVKAQAIVIHEALHTLGLGENPPSSAEITARVLERCRSWRTSRRRYRPLVRDHADGRARELPVPEIYDVVQDGKEERTWPRGGPRNWKRCKHCWRVLSATPPGNFGQLTAARDPRTVQLGIRLQF
jgi:hypothetical protein